MSGMRALGMSRERKDEEGSVGAAYIGMSERSIVKTVGAWG